jgi:hypothetical protein
VGDHGRSGRARPAVPRFTRLPHRLR